MDIITDQVRRAPRWLSEEEKPERVQEIVKPMLEERRRTRSSSP